MLFSTITFLLIINARAIFWCRLDSTGKDELVARCVDGETNGALPPCPEPDCGARLNVIAGQKNVFCPGKFNDEHKFFVKCFFKSVRLRTVLSAHNVVKLQPHKIAANDFVAGCLILPVLLLLHCRRLID